MRLAKGSAMTDEQVIEFVDGCEFTKTIDIITANGSLDYPAYELYTENLRNGVFPERKERQVRLVIGQDRRVRKVVEI